MRRLLMDSHQKRLTDPAAYDAPVNREQVLAAIDAGRAGRDHETHDFMRRSAKDIAAGTPLTIRKVADSFERSRRNIPGADPAYGDFPQLTFCGDSALLEFLIARANAVAEGVRPGADAVFGQAFKG